MFTQLTSIFILFHLISPAVNGSPINNVFDNERLQLQSLSEYNMGLSKDQDDGCATLFTSFTPAHKQSKYLIYNDYEWTEDSHTIGGVSTMKKFCEDIGLVLPSAAHYEDWISLQKILRNYAEKQSTDERISENKREMTVFAMGDRMGKYNGLKGTAEWISTSSGKGKIPAFTLWDTQRPVLPMKLKVLEPDTWRINDRPCLHARVRLISNRLYIAESNEKCDTKPTNGFLKVCMHSPKSSCFTDSKEEKDHQVSEYGKEVLSIETSKRDYFLHPIQKNKLNGAICQKDKGEKEFNYQEDATSKKLGVAHFKEFYYKLMQNMRKLDLYPHGAFLDDNMSHSFHYESTYPCIKDSISFQEDEVGLEVCYDDGSSPAKSTNSSSTALIRQSNFFRLCYKSTESKAGQKGRSMGLLSGVGGVKAPVVGAKKECEETEDSIYDPDYSFTDYK